MTDLYGYSCVESRFMGDSPRLDPGRIARMVDAERTVETGQWALVGRLVGIFPMLRLMTDSSVEPTTSN